MSIELPKPIHDYFDSANDADIERMIAPFADQATVRDEGIERAGRRAIRDWMETTQKYGAKAIPERVDRDGGVSAVTALVSGNFPGSPIHLTYRFSIERDQIVRLEIG
jgi:SnoaL-like domain